jgi:hypothetical protein
LYLFAATGFTHWLLPLTQVAYIAPSLTEDQKYILEKIKLGEYLNAEEMREVRSVDELLACHLAM